MRRKHLAVALGLPLANALSLQNFQQITSLLIPISCQLAYDEQIASCIVDDFRKGCSKSCKKGLKSVASDVSDACSSITVSSNTLLGIVMNGGIIEALCPTGTQTTQTTAAPSAIPDPAPAVSVTLPTASPGVTGGGGIKSSTATVASTTLTASRVSTSTKSRSSSTTADETSTSTAPSSTSSTSEDATTTNASQTITTSLERASPVTSSSKT